MTKAKIWYGDKPNRRCPDCGELVDWDERKRLGLVPVGGPTRPDGVTPERDAEANYGCTAEGMAEQAKMNAHHERYHRGGEVHQEERDGWRLEVYKASTTLATGRQALKSGHPYCGILWITSPRGRIVSETSKCYRSIAAVVTWAFGK